MLPHSQKINTQLFKEVLVGGKTYNSTYFSIKILKIPNKDFKSRFTCVVSKKVIKKAVSRNLFKRRFFNIIQEIYEGLPSSWAVVFFLKTGGEKLTFKDLKKELLKIFENIKM